MSYENVIWKQPRPATSGNKTQLLDRRPKVRSEENPEMKSTITRFWLITIALAVALAMSGCGGGGGGSSGIKTPMPDVTDPSANGQSDMSDFGPWDPVKANGATVGYENEGYGLMARFDARGANPTITASSPTHQPKAEGTWVGNWSARYTSLDKASGTFDAKGHGEARINVTIAGSNVEAVLTYTDIRIEGLPSSISSGRVSVTDGRFAPSVTVSIPTVGSRTFRGLGQFGGTDQKGVVGYISGPDFRSVFYGDQQ